MGEQVKHGSPVVIWTAFKERTINMKLVVDSGHIHENTYTLVAAVSALVYVIVY